MPLLEVTQNPSRQRFDSAYGFDRLISRSIRRFHPRFRK